MILNIVSTILFILVLGFSFLFFPDIIINFMNSFETWNSYFLFFPIIICYFILHEIFHAFSYILHGAKWEKITFGMELEKGVFYCLCKQHISRKNILNSLMFPLFYLGIVTYIISIIFNLPLLLILSILNISGAAGDIMYFIYMIKLKKYIKFSELDDGISFAILADYDVSKVKHIGLDFVEKTNKIEHKDFKKIKVSKLSFAVIILCILFIVVGIFV